MLRFNCEEWISLKRLVEVWPNELADGTTQADLWNDLCRFFRDGHLDHGGYIHKVTGRVPVPTHPELWRYLRPCGDWIFLSKQVVKDFARYCNRFPPSWCSGVTNGPSQPSRLSQPSTPALAAMPSWWSDTTNGPSQPSRPSQPSTPAPAAMPLWCSDTTNGLSQRSRPAEHLPPAPDAMIKEEIRFEYQRAAAAGEKPPNVKEVLPPVQRILQQKGCWASKRWIQKLAEDPEFKCLRLPPGKRWSKPGKN
jgi:hypothetical protein